MDAAQEALNAIRREYKVVERMTGECELDSNSIGRLVTRLETLKQTAIEQRDFFQQAEWMQLSMNITIIGQHLEKVLAAAEDVQAATAFNMGEHVYLTQQRMGRPRIEIREGLLRYALQHRTVSAVARFLGVSRPTVLREIRRYGIDRRCTGDARPGRVATLEELRAAREQDPMRPRRLNEFPTGIPLQEWDVPEIDALVITLLDRFRSAGARTLAGCIQRALGVRAPLPIVEAALRRVDPRVHIFGQRRLFRRRVYNVKGPHSLWHHDGQHDLIRWGIVMHGFVDGYSRLVPALRASTNNRAATVLDLFLEACRKYGIPVLLRGDHGVENLGVAAFMHRNFATNPRRKYIWGRSVHNQRIERLWRDVVKDFLLKWKELFEHLEEHHGLDPDNLSHRWLVQHLYIGKINADATLWSEGNHNLHKMRVPLQSRQSPMEMFGFGMMTEGRRGLELAEDLRGMSDTQIINILSREEAAIPWNEVAGPNTIYVTAPNCPASARELQYMDDFLSAPELDGDDANSLVRRWINGRAFCALNNVRGFV